jgi:signal transduction histidine kinase/DNA-binding response OmpR family regulator
VAGLLSRLARALRREGPPDPELTRDSLVALMWAGTLACVAIAAWVLASTWFLITTNPEVRAESIALHVALLIVISVPLLVRFASNHPPARLLRNASRNGNRPKSDLLATMSHEIRTPLNAVLGYSELLAKTTLDDTQRDYLQGIRTSGNHLLSIINDVLDYSKIQAGRIELEEKAFEVVPLVEGCIKAVSVDAAAKGLAVGFLCDESMPKALFGDATRVRQVLLNLLSNAVKFTESGEVAVSAKAAALGEGRYLVRFDVKDTGIGIPDHAKGRLFQAFSQVDASTTRLHGGTGLGLAISRRLCELMGGDLTFESQVGRGSTFTATIRLMASPAAPETHQDHEALRGLRLLVVDGNPMNRTILCRNAQAWGMTPRATGDPDQAMAWIQSGDPFDLAILDNHLARMDGHALAERIRSAGRASLPMLLASNVEAKPPPGRPDPFIGRIRKPILSGELLQAILAACGQGTAEPQPRVRHDLRVLLVEDNLMNQRLALQVLRSLGYDADVAENGQQAVDAVLAKEYGVVLMDVHMPIMDGLQATRTICRQVPRHARPLIVGLTANALPGDREMCLRAGMDEYLPKPMDHERLATLLLQAERRPGHGKGRAKKAKVAA